MKVETVKAKPKRKAGRPKGSKSGARPKKELQKKYYEKASFKMPEEKTISFWNINETALYM